jgi:uncharacterized membrane protein YjjP (DUF1212 family)
MHEVTDTTVSPPSAFAQLGAFLLDAGYAVTDVDFALYKVAEKAGYPDMAFVVLPATVFASDHPGDATTVVNATGVELPLLITARANLLVRRLLAGKVPFWRIPEHIAKVRASTAHITWWELLLGSSGLAGGLGVLFRIPWWAVIATFVLGALIGVAIHLGSKVRGAGTIITFLVAFGTTLSVGLLASHFELGPIPLFAVCAPLAVLVPGTTITNALLELSATDMITGSSRLMYGLLVLAFMTVGIGAAAMATGLRCGSRGSALWLWLPGSVWHSRLGGGLRCCRFPRCCSPTPGSWCSRRTSAASARRALWVRCSSSSHEWSNGLSRGRQPS